MVGSEGGEPQVAAGEGGRKGGRGIVGLEEAPDLNVASR